MFNIFMKICDDVFKESIQIAEKISNNSPLAIRYALQSIISGINTPSLESFDIENNYFSS